MKIGFVVMKRGKDSNIQWQPFRVCYTNKALDKYRDDEDFYVVSEDTLNTIQGLKYNKDFNYYIKQSREYLNIPNKGLPFERFYEIYQRGYKLDTYDKLIDPEYQEPLSSFWASRKVHISQTSHLSMGIGGYTNRELLVLYGVVAPTPDRGINWDLRGLGAFSDISYSPFVHLSINVYNDISLQKILTYIRKNYKHMTKKMALNLPKHPKDAHTLLTKNDLELLEYAYKGLSEKERYERVKYRYAEGSEETVLKAYKRAKARLKKIFSLKKRDKN